MIAPPADTLERFCFLVIFRKKGPQNQCAYFLVQCSDIIFIWGVDFPYLLMHASGMFIRKTKTKTLDDGESLLQLPARLTAYSEHRN
jgi:hypothetical protein